MTTARKLPLESQFIQYIKRNHLFAGARLPSIATLAKQFQAGKDTVSAALLDLQNEGIIEIRKNDGCYILPTAWELLYKATPNWAHLAGTSWYGGEKRAEWQPNHANVINLSVGHLSDEFGYNSYIADALSEAAKMIRSGSVTYDVDPLGRLSFRQAIQRFLRDFRGIECDPSQIIHTLGTGQTLTLLIQSLLNHNTPLCVGAPNALSIMTLLGSYGIRLLEHGINDLDSLKNLLLPYSRAVYMLTPHSYYPSGASISQEFREGLIAYAHKRKLPIIETDSYNDLTDTSGDTLKSADTNDAIIYCGTLVNTYTVGIPVNWMVVPVQMVERFAHLVTQNNVIPATLPELAVELLLREGVVEDYLRQAKQIFRKRVALTQELFTKHLGPYAEWEPDNICLSAWVGMKKPEYAQAVLTDPRLYVLSGAVFGREWGNYLSICPCNQSEENLTKGVALMGEILSGHK